MKDKIDELDPAIRAYLPEFIRNRLNELTAIKASLAQKDFKTILEWTHKVLGVAANYKLYQLELLVDNFEKAVQSEQEAFAGVEFDEIESYLVEISNKFS